MFAYFVSLSDINLLERNQFTDFARAEILRIVELFLRSSEPDCMSSSTQSDDWRFISMIAVWRPFKRRQSEVSFFDCSNCNRWSYRRYERCAVEFREEVMLIFWPLFPSRGKYYISISISQLTLLWSKWDSYFSNSGHAKHSCSFYKSRPRKMLGSRSWLTKYWGKCVLGSHRARSGRGVAFELFDFYWEAAAAPICVRGT